MNSDNKYMSRSFMIVIYAITGAIALAWHLRSETVVTVVIPAALTAWFGGKIFQGKQSNNNNQV